MMIPSFDAIKAINRHRKDAVVVSTMTPTQYWVEVSNKSNLDLPIFGAMGKASSVGLGLALSRPDKKVLVLDGDGSILMNLGSLITIADQQPKNFVHFVFQDDVYYTTGGQPIPGSNKVDLANIAKHSGIKSTYQFDDLEDFVSDLPNIMKQTGPVFVCLKVNHANKQPEEYFKDTGESMRQLSSTLQNMTRKF